MASHPWNDCWAYAGSAGTGSKWKAALVSNVGLLMLTLLGGGLIGTLHGAAGGTGPAGPKKGPPAAASSKQQPTIVCQLGHSAFVTAVAFSPDCKQVATASSDHTTRLWHAASGREILVFQGHTNDVTSVAFSPNGTQILTGSKDCSARLWDAVSGKEIRVFLTFAGHAGAVEAVAFSSDGTQIATAYSNNSIRLWHTSNGKVLRTISVNNSYLPVKSVAFSPDDKQVLTASGETSARLWDAANGREIRSFKEEEPVITAIFSPDGKRVLTASRFQPQGFSFSDPVKGTIRLWDAASGKQLLVFQGPAEHVSCLAFSADGKQVLSGSKTGTAWLWDAVSGKSIRPFKGPVFAGWVTSVALSRDGNQVLTSSEKTARLWDTANGGELRKFDGAVNTTIKLSAVAFSPDGKQVAIGSPDKTAQLWDVASGKQVRIFRHNEWVSAVAFSADAKQLLTGGGLYSDYTARLWDLASGKEIRAFRGHTAPITSVALSPDGKLAATGSQDQTARLWDAASGKEMQRWRTFKKSDPKGYSPVEFVAFSPDGKQVLTGSYWMAQLWEVAAGKEIRSFNNDENLLSRFAFSNNGKHVLTVNSSTAWLWDTATGKWIRAFQVGHWLDAPKRFNDITCAAFSPDGKQLLTGCSDGSVVLWDTTDGEKIRVLNGHTGILRGLAFSPDNKRVLSAGDDRTVRLWEAASGRELCQLLSLADGSWAAVTPENYYMASRGGLEAVAFRLGNRVFSFDQFDLKFNRPDKVIERIGLASPEMIAAYRHAYQKRLKRMNFTQEMLSDDFHVPGIVVKSAPEHATRAKTLKLQVQASDSKYLLDRLHIDVNGVPLHGAAGISLRKPPSKTWDQEIEVELSSGKNKIDLSVLNEKGSESLKETLALQCNAPADKPNLYVVAVGVSDYHDSRFRLTYADKDARDLADLFESKRDRFGAVKVLRILNRDATRANILKAKDFLKGSQVDDMVVLFLAGHGLLDSKLDYYFATADIDFKNPAKNGLPYEDIEGLLEGSRARKKLLLMDTCHSGELDKDEVQVVGSEKQPEGEIKVRTFRLDLEIKPKVGLGNSYQLLQEMFADLRRGTGTVVIASAGGAEFALESAAWQNGVFTHAVLRGLKGEADRNRDKRVQVSELRDFVEQEVRRLTNGRQTPTSRRENLAVDFQVD